MGLRGNPFFLIAVKPQKTIHHGHNNIAIAALHAKHLIFTWTAIVFVAGGLAGLSMIWYRSSSIALYLASKISEVRMKKKLNLVALSFCRQKLKPFDPSGP